MGSHWENLDKLRQGSMRLPFFCKEKRETCYDPCNGGKDCGKAAQSDCGQNRPQKRRLKATHKPFEVVKTKFRSSSYGRRYPKGLYCNGQEWTNEEKHNKDSIYYNKNAL